MTPPMPRVGTTRVARRGGYPPLTITNLPCTSASNCSIARPMRIWNALEAQLPFLQLCPNRLNPGELERESMGFTIMAHERIVDRHMTP